MDVHTQQQGVREEHAKRRFPEFCQRKSRIGWSHLKIILSFRDARFKPRATLEFLLLVFGDKYSVAPRWRVNT